MIIQQNGNTVITAVGADGNLYLNWLSSSTSEWSGWGNLGSGGGGFATTPSMIIQPQNGNTVITAIGVDGNLYLNWQSSTTAEWSGWGNLGSGGGGFATTPSIIIQPNSNTVITAIGADGNLYLNWLSSSTSEWSGWGNLGSGGGGFEASPSMVIQPENINTVITAIGADGNLYLNWQSSTTAEWSGWVNLGGGGGGFVTTPSMIIQPNDNTVITGIGADKNLYLNWQSSTTAEWSGWGNLGSEGGGLVPPSGTLTISGSPGVPLNGTSTYSVQLSSAPQISLFIIGAGAGQASFDNGSSSLSLTQSGQVQIHGNAASGTAGDVEVVALSQSNVILARLYVSVVSVQVTVRTSGDFSPDDTAASNVENAISALGSQIAVDTGLPGFPLICATTVEYVGVVSPSNYSGTVVLRRNINSVLFNNQTASPGQQGDDTSFPDHRVDTPTSVGHIYDIDGPGVSPIPGNATQVGRVRANFTEYAVLDSASSSNVASNMLQVFARASCQGNYGTSAMFVNVIPGDNIAGPGTTPLTWNLQ